MHGDVQIRHHLETRNDVGREFAAELHRIPQTPVDAVPHSYPLFLGLNVNVRRAFTDTLGNNRIDETNRRRIRQRVKIEIKIKPGLVRFAATFELVPVDVDGVMPTDGAANFVQRRDDRHHLVAPAPSRRHLGPRRRSGPPSPK